MTIWPKSTRLAGSSDGLTAVQPRERSILTWACRENWE
jgi:hypothetical protein